MATKIYIAGKITGDPDYKAKFNAAAEAYKKKGYTVLNPSWMPEGMQKADYMRICFAMIDTADVVAFLPGYETSPGAQLELQYCFYIDKDVKLPECKHPVLIREGNGPIVCNQCGAVFKDATKSPKNIRCADCQHLMFSDCYGECDRGYISGILSPDDYCSRAVRRKEVKP